MADTTVTESPAGAAGAGAPPAPPAPTDATSAAGNLKSDPAVTPMGTLKSDLHQIADSARKEFSSLSAAARADVQKVIHDVEALHGANLSALKKMLGF